MRTIVLSNLSSLLSSWLYFGMVHRCCYRSRLCLNLGVVCYPFDPPVGARVIRQQEVQRGDARSHERVRRSLHNIAHQSYLPKAVEDDLGQNSRGTV